MPRRTTWRDLAVGLVALGVITAIAASTLLFARVGALHGKTFPLYLLTGEARGVIRGTEVWLDGQKVGVVKDMGFLGPSSGDANRLVLQLDVLSRVRQHIRFDSRATIRSGGSLISSSVIYVNSGTARTRAVVPGDTIRTLEQTDFETASAALASAAKELPLITANVKALSTELGGAEGAFGAAEGKALLQLGEISARASRLINRLGSSHGSVGLLSSAAAFSDRAQRSMAAVDSIRALLASDRTSLGRFRRDSTLVREVGAVRTEIGRVRALAASPDGTLGRLQADSAIRQSLNDAYPQMDSLFADLRKHPLRYIAF